MVAKDIDLNQYTRQNNIAKYIFYRDHHRIDLQVSINAWCRSVYGTSKVVDTRPLEFILRPR